jgi:hypothetical protein
MFSKFLLNVVFLCDGPYLPTVIFGKFEVGLYELLPFRELWTWDRANLNEIWLNVWPEV